MQYNNFNTNEAMKNALTNEARELFEGRDFYILADFCGDVAFSDDPWMVYDQYFDHDLWEADAEACRKRWAYEVCQRLAGDYDYSDFPEEDPGISIREVRRENAHRDKFPEPHTSCFRKGYHKYQKNWKKVSSKKRRHNDKAALRRGNIPFPQNYEHYNRWLETSTEIDYDIIKEYVRNDFFSEDGCDNVREAYDVHLQKTPDGIMAHILYEMWSLFEDWDDPEAWYECGSEVIFLSHEKIRDIMLEG